MRYGIFSDVHSNLEAFETACDYYTKQKIDKFLFIGDIIGYGADPGECIWRLMSLNPKTVAGNHDWAVVNKFSPDYFNAYAKEALFWTKKQLTEENCAYLRAFPLIYEEDDFICVHSTLKNPDQFNYIFDFNDARINFPFLKKRVCFVGHSHRMEVYCLTKEEISCSRDYKVKLNSQSKYIINVGSVGQPRDKDPRLSLCIYDSDKEIIELARLDYNIKKAAEKILKKGLPSVLAMRLYSGW